GQGDGRAAVPHPLPRLVDNRDAGLGPVKRLGAVAADVVVGLGRPAAGGDGVVAHGRRRGQPGILPGGDVPVEQVGGVVLGDVDAVDDLGGLVAVGDRFEQAV